MNDNSQELGNSQVTVLAVSSPGGHWQQLTSIRQALDGMQVTYVTTAGDAAAAVAPAPLVTVTDCNRNEPLKLLRCAWETYRVVRNMRPDVIITTGAAPGLFAVIAGRLCGSRTVWLDSLANSERLSLSGRVASKFVDLCITQWHHLSSPGGPHYFGEIL